MSFAITVIVIFLVIFLYWIFRNPVKRMILLLDKEAKALITIEENRLNSRVKGLKTLQQLKEENPDFWSEF